MSALTIQTNIASLIAQTNLQQTNLFQQNTITALTSGYRINKSGDDPAGLAVANGYAASIAELTQGVRNANDGVSTLQIVDGGLSNISTILNRLQTLATQSASGTFTGDRATLNNEYQTLLSEITRQASNIGLNAGGSNNTILNVFIGGGNNLGNSQVSINLSGAGNAVDALSLGLSSTSILGGGTSFAQTAPVVNNLNDPNALFDVGAGQSETFAVQYLNSQNQIANTTLTINGSVNGQSGSAIVASLNNQLQTAGATGIGTQIGSDGTLQFTGGNLLSVVYANSGVTAPTVNPSVASNNTLVNGANYQSTGAFTGLTDGGGPHTTEGLQITVGGKNYGVTLTSDTTNASQEADTQSHAIASLNTQLQGSGVYAVANGAGQITLEGSSAFTVAETSYVNNGGGSLFGTTVGAQAVAAPTPNASATGNAANAVTAVTAAIAQLGLTQGRVGAGENDLSYATNLANSQITSFSAAESRIRDADMAAEAANLTKAQVLEQASLAAMAQANAAPQAVLALLK